MPHPLLNRRLLQDNQPLANMAWTGATWALDGSGRAYNVPTLGAELLTDGGLENWTTATNLTSWIESISGASTINRDADASQGAFAARFDIDASNNSAFLRQDVATVNRWFRLDAVAKTNTSASVSLGTTNNPWLMAVTRSLPASYSAYFATGRAINASLIIARSAATGASFYFDDLRFREISLPTTLATIAGTPTQTAAAKIHTLTTGTQAGVVSLLDSASNPQNFLIGYHDGTNVRLDKCVSGAYTNLITTAVAFTSLAQIEIRRPSGNTFQLWYNGTQRGTDQTVSDAGIIGNTIYGLFSTYDGNLFSEFSLGDVVIPFQLPGA